MRHLLKVLICVGAVVLCLGCRGTKIQPRQVSFWYWNTPFEISDSMENQLRGLGVNVLFVRAGTLSAVDHEPQLTSPQQWTSTRKPFHAHLVFRFDDTITRRFESMPNEALVTCISAAFSAQRKSAENFGLKVKGIQIDFDCPARLLPKYAALLKAIRRSAFGSNGLQLSITGLISWTGSEHYTELANAVDFVVPQMYEAAFSSSMDSPKAIGEPEKLADRMERASRSHLPFWIGVPAYGRAMLYSPTGKFLGAYHGLGLAQAFSHPALQYEKTEKIPGAELGETRVIFRAIRAAADGSGVGNFLVYQVPNPEAVAMHFRIYHEAAPSNCLGAIVYRLPEINESVTIPMEALVLAVQGKKASPELTLTAQPHRSPYANIERPGHGLQFTWKLELDNVGSMATYPSKEGTWIEISATKPGLDVSGGNGIWSEGVDQSGRRASRERAASWRVSTPFLWPGDSLSDVEFLAEPGQTYHVRWGGLDASGRPLPEKSTTLELPKPGEPVNTKTFR